MTTTDTTRTLVHVDPTTIVLDTNVRTDARLDKDFVASVRDHGVMQPVVGYRDQDGAVHVLQGQRRTLAAVETQRETIPVYLAETPDEAGRIITQMVEN
ncbi:ParB N-terminal domain-containing protein, partial [Brachybacterium paraconglomeratum]